MKKILCVLLTVLCLMGGATQAAETSYGDTLVAVINSLMEDLPNEYSIRESEKIGEITNKISCLEDAGKGISDLDGELYEKYLGLKSAHSGRLSAVNRQDRIYVNYKGKTPDAWIDMFEYSTVTSAAQIPDKKGIVMSSSNNEYYPSNIKSGTFIGFYSTDKTAEKYQNTFPDSFNEYYITNNSVQYQFDGISKNAGDNTPNAGLLTSKTSYDIDFDNETKYDSVNILASSIHFLSGPYGRELCGVKVKVYYADGTVKEQNSIAGPFCYGYKIGIYEKGDDDVYTALILKNMLNEDQFSLFKPAEANVSDYFNVSSGIRGGGNGVYNVDRSIGNVSAIKVDTEGKAINKISVSRMSANDLLKAGALVGYNSRDTNKRNPMYFLNFDKSQIASAAGYASLNDCYLAVTVSDGNPVILSAVTGIKTTAGSYLDEINDIKQRTENLSASFSEEEFGEIGSISRKIEFLKNQGVSEYDFGTETIEKIKRLENYLRGEDNHIKIYVSNSGNDSASGTYENPIKTFEYARTLARKYNKSGETVDVIFKQGVYKFSETAEFTTQDSGTSEHPITYMGEGETVFTTGDYVNASDFEKPGDGELTGKVKDGAEKNILKLNLSKLNINPGSVPSFSSTGILGDGYDDMTVTVGDREQPVAQYPNGESNYGTWARLYNRDINSGAIRLKSSVSRNWDSEKSAYFEGYPSPDYSNERNNLTIAENILYFKNPARFSLDEAHSRRYKVKHILYELDSPGEWYCDREKNILYYYPSEGFKENDEICISSRKGDLFSGSGLKYVTFKNITFKNIRGNVFNLKTNADSVRIERCTFKNITNTPIILGASKRGTFSASYTDFADGAVNCIVSDNRFISTGSTAVEVKGGSVSGDVEGNNIVTNNYLYDTSNKQRCTPAVNIVGYKNSVINNEIHKITFHAINHSGFSNYIAYNEIYDAVRDTGDCGIIYTGRSFARQGTEIAYNYIHNYGQNDERTTDDCVGIYLDDRQSGIYVHHNILYPDGVGKDGNGIQNGAGQFNRIEYNIIVDAEDSMTVARSNRSGETITSEGNNLIDEMVNILGLEDEGIVRDDGSSNRLTGKTEITAITSKYPAIKEMAKTLMNPNVTVREFVNTYPYVLDDPYINTAQLGNLKEAINSGADLTGFRLLSLRPPVKNSYKYNLSTDEGASYEEAKNEYAGYGTVFENNCYTLTKDNFIDYEGKDFRIKKSSPYYSEGVLSEDFDLDRIGILDNSKRETMFTTYYRGIENANLILKDIITENVRKANILSDRDKKFYLTYPAENGEIENLRKVLFQWETPVGADTFRLEIATDSEMKNIIYTNEDTFYSFDNVTSLPAGYDVFYWRVTAKNIGRDGESWENAGGIHSFRVPYSAVIDTDDGKMTPFDIRTDFNAKYFSMPNEAREDNLGLNNATLGNFNLENFKNIVDEDGVYYDDDVKYMFHQTMLESTDKAMIATDVYKKENGKNYVYTLKENETGCYNKIYIAGAAKSPTADYSLKFTYEDGSVSYSKAEIAQYYTTYYNSDSCDVLFVTDGVNYLGNAVSRSCINRLYKIEFTPDCEKRLVKIEFEGGYRCAGGVAAEPLRPVNDLIIFAITGQITQNSNDMGISVSSYMKDSINAIVTDCESNGEKNKILTYPAELTSAGWGTGILLKNAVSLGNTKKKIMVWESGTLKPLAVPKTEQK